MRISSTGEPAPPFSFYGSCGGTIAVMLLCPLAVWGQEPQDTQPPDVSQEVRTVQLAFKDEPSSVPTTAPTTLGEILRLCLLQVIDDEYVDDRHWGETAERFDGFDVRGLRISKRERTVNHGFWQRYKARLLRPEETLKIDVQQAPGSDETIVFTLLMTLRARCEVTFAWWNYGVKGWNGTAVSDATVQMRLVLETRPQFRFSLAAPFPGVDLHPRITHVDLKLKDLDLHRLGVFEGPLVTALGDGSRKAIESLLQRQSDRLKTRLQKKIEESGSHR